MLLPWHIEERIFRPEAVQRVDDARDRIRELAERKYPPTEDPDAERAAERRRVALERRLESAVFGSLVQDFLARELPQAHHARAVFNRAGVKSRKATPGSVPLTLTVDREPMLQLVHRLRPIASRAADLDVRDPELLVFQFILMELPLEKVRGVVDTAALSVAELKGVVECSADSSSSLPSRSA